MKNKPKKKKNGRFTISRQTKNWSEMGRFLVAAATLIFFFFVLSLTSSEVSFV